MGNYFDVIIFTKDRPAQYDLLCRSLYMWRGVIDFRVFAVYKRTSDAMHDAYMKTEGKGYLIQETTFKETLNTCIRMSKSENIIMLPDDNVIIGVPSQAEIEALLRYACCSIRLHPAVNYCQPANKKITVPKLKPHKGIYYWNMNETERFLCWGYPQCIENIHRKDELYSNTVKWNFRHSGDLECLMGGMYNNSVLMACFDRPMTVNIPWNRILDTKNPTIQGFSSKEGYDRFMSGQRLSLQHILDLPPQNACHIEVEPLWQ